MPRNRTEVHVGWPTVKAIVGDKIAPRFGDWDLARNGYEAQNKRTNQPHRTARIIFGLRYREIRRAWRV